MRDEEITNLRKQYFDAIIKLQDKNDIIAMLPSFEYASFFPIINGILELLESSIIELQKEVNKTENQPEDMQELFKQELQTMIFKKEICQARLSEAEKMNLIEKTAFLFPKKNLIFATTDSGNVYLEKDLKSFTEEYLDEIYDSLEKLENGFEEENIQKGRMLQNNNKLSGIHEIKPFKVRLFYRNLSEDTVYILLAKIKKSDNDKLDREEVIDRNKKTQSEYNILKEIITDPEKKQELIIQNIEIKNKIFNYIKQNRRG